MASPRLAILDMPNADEARGLANRPRALQRHDFSTAPCAACNAACCRAGSVELTTVEALRLAYGAMLGLDAVVQRMALPAGEEKTPRLASLPIPLVDGAVVLRLRHALVGGGCTFLVHAIDQSRCGVHALRPGACRFFPFRFSAGGQTYQVGTDAICPTKWVQTEELRAGLERDHRRWRADLRQEKRLITAWKTAGGAGATWTQFTAFARGFAEQVMGLEAPARMERTGRGLGERLW